MSQRGDELTKKILAGGNEGANELLNEFLDGYPVMNLQRLLESTNEHAVKAGAWIASELGTEAVPLVPSLAPLLTHPLRYVRFFTIDTVLVCAGRGDGHLLTLVVKMLREADDAVRWKALGAIAKMTRSQLAESLLNQDDKELAEQTVWLLRIEEKSNVGLDIMKKLDATAGIERSLGVVAAVRIATTDPDPLKQATISSDLEIKSFALEQLKLLSIGQDPI